MTKKEKHTCKEMAKKGLAYARECQKYSEKYDRYKKENNSVEAEIALRWMDHYGGCAFGIHQTLTCLGFKDENMKKLGGKLSL